MASYRKYVLGFMVSPKHQRVVLIPKQKPADQLGKFNGIGGKIEDYDESALAAMVREFGEETGLETEGRLWDYLGVVTFSGGEIHCFRYVWDGDELPKFSPGPKSGGDIIQLLAREYGTPARWAKARIHLRESGKIEDSPRDIGELMKEIPADVQKECEAEIKARLFSWAWPQLKRAITRGVPEWYKGLLLLEETSAALASTERIVEQDFAEDEMVRQIIAAETPTIPDTVPLRHEFSRSPWVDLVDRGHGSEIPGDEKNRLAVSPV